jgi:homocysteine S-methyltransferase
MVLDGGLATELEERGCDINDRLWSAKVLLENPDVIVAVHHDYLAAGADCIMSASYQATIEGFVDRGLSESDAIETIGASVRLAVEVRDEFWEKPENRAGRLRPLVAASVGPYGAFLADGSEYDGHYGLTRTELTSFHRERWHALAESGPDLLACETIPSAVEALAFIDLLAETPDIAAWVGFSCADALRLYDGSSLQDAVKSINGSEQVVAIGVNCVPPSLVPALIEVLRESTTKPIVVYPNSGERYDATTKRWFGISDPLDFKLAAIEWYELGACLVGGCCRTGPEHIGSVREGLSGMPKSMC